MTTRMRNGRLAAAVFFATFFILSPPARADLADGQEVQIQIIKTTMAPGDPVPDVVPDAFRSQVAAKTATAQPGSTIVVIDPDATVMAPQKVVNALNSITTRDGGRFWPLLLVILVIVLVVTVIVGTLLNLANQIPPPPTNDESSWTNGIGITSPSWMPGNVHWLTNEATSTSTSIMLEGCTNLAEGRWFELATITASTLWANTNGPSTLDWCTVDVSGPQGYYGQALVSGLEENPATLLPRTPPIRVPAPDSPVLFMRTRSL